MTWSYDESDLGTSTASGRLNAVRLLIFDTDTNNQLLQDEEITFALSEVNDRVYYAAAWCARVISAKYSAQVDTTLDESLEAKYSQRAEQYSKLSIQLKEMAKQVSGSSLGIKAGGISKVTIETVRDNTDRPDPAFWTRQFNNPPEGYDDDLEGYL